MRAEVKRKLATTISNLLNPFLVSLIVITIISFKATTSTFEALKWALIALSFSIFPVFMVIIHLIRQEKLEGISIRVRKQRYSIYLLATVCAMISCAVLIKLSAPRILTASFVAGLVSIATFMCINLLWKISVHTAFVSSSVIILIILYGPMGTLSVMLLPIISWSRIVLKHHSPAQVIAGSLVATIIVLAVFRFFGIIGTTSL